MKKRMILALVLVFALLCLACSNDADDGASSSESVRDDQSVSVAETSTDASAESSSRTESTSSADETSGESSSVESSSSSDTSSGTSGTDSSASSNPSESRDTNSETSSDTSSETPTGTESSATSSDTSTSSKPTEGSENSKPSEGSESSDTSSGSGNTNPSQTGHKHNYKTTVVKPTCTEDGYTLHKCSCGDSYKDSEVPATGHELDTWTLRTVKAPTYTEPGIHERQCLNCGEWVVDESIDADWEPPVTDESLVYQRIIAMESKYPTGTKTQWNETGEYHSKGMGITALGGCTAFAYFLSDTAFGNYWGYRKIEHFKLENVRPGDILRINQDTHTVIVLEVRKESIVVAEGSNSGIVCWNREYGKDVVESANYMITRYDPPQKS